MERQQALRDKFNILYRDNPLVEFNLIEAISSFMGDEKAYISDNNNSIRFTKNGKTHRDNGPAIVEVMRPCVLSLSMIIRTDLNYLDIPEFGDCRLIQAYYQDGMYHREDGPAYIKVSSKSIEEKWYKLGNQHRKDGPAFVQTGINGQKILEIWYENGQEYRKDGPTRIEYHNNGNIKSITWSADNIIERLEGPAVVVFYENNQVKEEKYYSNNRLDRENGPAVVYFDKYGQKSKEEWFRNGVRHRAGAPAVVEYYSSGSIKREEWIENGIPVQSTNPSVISYYTDNNILSKEWFENGKIISRTTFYPNGSIKIQELFKKGFLNSTNSPAVVEFDENKMLTKEEWYYIGRLHREDGPAQTIFKNGTIQKQMWYVLGKLFREEGPAMIIYEEKEIIERVVDSNYIDWEYNPNETSKTNNNGKIVLEQWFDYTGFNGRIDGPAKVVYENGIVQQEFWYFERVLTNEDGPAEIHYYSDGILKSVKWMVDGEPSYPKGFYFMEFYYNGNLKQTIGENGTIFYDEDENIIE